MDQLPNLGREQEMLESMGMKSIDELFSNIPAAIRRDGPLPLREPQTEEEIWADAQRLLSTNVRCCDKIRKGDKLIFSGRLHLKNIKCGTSQTSII